MYFLSWMIIHRMQFPISWTTWKWRQGQFFHFAPGDGRSGEVDSGQALKAHDSGQRTVKLTPVVWSCQSTAVTLW